jgi:hypothetical protein
MSRMLALVRHIGLASYASAASGVETMGTKT